MPAVATMIKPVQIAGTILTLVLIGAANMSSAAQKIAVDARVPADFPEQGFAHGDFEELLARYVDAKGHVDYESWHGAAQDVLKLNEYLAAVAAYSPENSSERFSMRHDELAYWMYAYNAYVIKSILDRWPLESVTDVRAPIEFAKGYGFFYRQRFMFGEEWHSLYTIENKKIRARYKDARIHFVLNCGSQSCPVLRPELPTGVALEPFLQDAATQFVSESRNVRIDHANRRVMLSDIFKMYKKDFISDLRLRGLPTDDGLIGYVASIAPESLRDELIEAADYDVVFDNFNWAVNIAD